LRAAAVEWLGHRVQWHGGLWTMAHHHHVTDHPSIHPKTKDEDDDVPRIAAAGG